MKKCEICSTPSKTVYHYAGCPYQEELSWRLYIPERMRADYKSPIEKADQYLIRSGLEKEGAKGWIPRYR